MLLLVLLVVWAVVIVGVAVLCVAAARGDRDERLRRDAAAVGRSFPT